MENHFNCIYLYTNKVNGKKYVGQAVDFLIRHKQHFYNAYNPKSNEYDMYFHKSIRKRTNHDFKKYEEIYSVEILKEDLSTQEELNYWEDYYMLEFDLLHNRGKGYNCKLNGINGQTGNPLAGKSDEEMKEFSRKMSETWKNRTDEELAEISRKISEATKEVWKNRTDEELAEISRKISEAMSNKSDEEKAERSRKISEARKGKFTGKNNPSARKIVSVDPSAKQPVFIWQYKKQATEFYGIKYTTLDYYLKGKSKKGHLYNGFLWYYLDTWEQLTN